MVAFAKSYIVGLTGGVLLTAATAFAQGMPGDPIIVVPQQQEMPGEALIIEPAEDDKNNDSTNEDEPGVVIERVAPRSAAPRDNSDRSAQEGDDRARLAKRFIPVRKPAPPGTAAQRAIPQAVQTMELGDGSTRQAVIPLGGIQLSGAATSALRRRGFTMDGDAITVTWPAPGQDGTKLVSQVKDEPLNFYGEFFECRTGQRYVCGLTIAEREALATLATRSQDENCPIEVSDNATTFTPSTSGDRGAFLDGPVIDIMDVMTVLTVWDRGEIGVPEWSAFMNASCNRACGRPGIYRAMSWRPGGLEYVHRGYKTAFASCSAR